MFSAANNSLHNQWKRNRVPNTTTIEVRKILEFLKNVEFLSDLCVWFDFGIKINGREKMNITKNEWKRKKKRLRK